VPWPQPPRYTIQTCIYGGIHMVSWGYSLYMDQLYVLPAVSCIFYNYKADLNFYLSLFMHSYFPFSFIHLVTSSSSHPFTPSSLRPSIPRFPPFTSSTSSPIPPPQYMNEQKITDKQPAIQTLNNSSPLHFVPSPPPSKHQPNQGQSNPTNGTQTIYHSSYLSHPIKLPTSSIH
jgi:hypothetical protein